MAAKVISATKRPNPKMAGPKLTKLAPGTHLKSRVVNNKNVVALTTPIPAPVPNALQFIPSLFRSETFCPSCRLI